MKNTHTMDAILQLTKRLVVIPSVKNDKASLRNVLSVAEKELKGFRKETFVKRGIPSLLVSNTVEKRNFKIILNAHLDVIADIPEHFTPVEKNGRLYCRGSYDMKGAAAVMILLFREIANKLPYPIALQLVTDEEYSGEYGTGYQVKKGVRGKFVIIGEAGSNMAIKNTAKGHIGLKLTTRGISGHGAYPWESENAIMFMHETIDKIKARFPTPKKAQWKSTVTVSRIESSNKIHNRIPDECTAYLDVRFIPEEKDDIVAEIKKILHKKVEIEPFWVVDHHYTDPKNGYIAQLQSSIKHTLKEKPKMLSAHGASDARIYTAVGNAAVEFGPVGSGHHTNREWLDVQSLENYYQIIKHFLLSIAEDEIKDTLTRFDKTGINNKIPVFLEQD